MVNESTEGTTGDAHHHHRDGSRTENRAPRIENREPGPLGANQKSLRTNKGLPRVRPSPTFVMLRSLMIERQGDPAPRRPRLAQQPD